MNLLIRYYILMYLLKREEDSSQINPDMTSSQPVSDSIDPALLSHSFSRQYRVLPHDMSFRDHLPNYRYLSFIELNITGLLFDLQKKNKVSDLKIEWIISMQEMVYLKQIRVFNKMTITSTIEGWDNKYLYLQHKFYVKKSLMAIGLTKFVLTDEERLISPEILGLKNKHTTEVIDTWNANQSAIKAQNVK